MFPGSSHRKTVPTALVKSMVASGRIFVSARLEAAISLPRQRRPPVGAAHLAGCQPLPSGALSRFLGEVFGRPVDEASQFLGCLYEEAVGEQLGHLGPVGVRVQDHCDDIVAPSGPVERQA
jgi:hypothetical protein